MRPAVRGRLWRSPPGLLFHLVLAVPVVVLLYALSFPGVDLVLAAPAALVLLAALAVWVARLVTYLLARRDGETAARAWPFVAVPVALTLLVIAALAALPLRVRWWACGDDEFAALVIRLPPAPVLTTRGGWTTVESPERVGCYDIVLVERVGDAVIFTEATGSGFDNAGFAFLPTGPSPLLEQGAFEAPRWRHLGGPWYSWTASW